MQLVPLPQLEEMVLEQRLEEMVDPEQRAQQVADLVQAHLKLEELDLLGDLLVSTTQTELFKAGHGQVETQTQSEDSAELQEIPLVEETHPLLFRVLRVLLEGVEVLEVLRFPEDLLDLTLQVLPQILTPWVM